MPTKEDITKTLDSVLVPAVKRSVVQLNLVREIDLTDGEVKLSLASAALNTGTQDWVKVKSKEALGKLPGINEAEVSFVEARPQQLNDVGHIIAVMSGKGGVGKSLVSSLVAIALKRRGYEVGILDGDITGPSIPRMFGIDYGAIGSESGILPVVSRSGIELMSINRMN